MCFAGRGLVEDYRLLHFTSNLRVELIGMLKRLRAENAKLKSKNSAGLSFKVSEKGAVSLYGMGRFPLPSTRNSGSAFLPVPLRSKR
jgi:hypothetical protein